MTNNQSAMKRIKELPKNSRKQLLGWYMYDWANSAFSTSISTALLPVYFVILFQQAIGSQIEFFSLKFTGSSLWSLSIGISTLIVAVVSPVLGVIADQRGIKKLLLFYFTLVGSFFTVLIFFTSYSDSAWAWILFFFIIANIGFSAANVFYNALLNDLVLPQMLDEASSKGFAFGYIGGGLALAIHLVVVQLTTDTPHSDLFVRLCIASVGIWWFGWSIWTFKSLENLKFDKSEVKISLFEYISLGFSGLLKTFQQIRNYKVVVIFLIAFLFFSDGLATILGVAGAYASDSLGVGMTFVMGTILIIQFIAAPGAAFFDWLSRKLSTKKSLLISWIGWVVAIIFAIGLAPLIPVSDSEFDYVLEKSSTDQYIILKSPELSDSKNESDFYKLYSDIEEGDFISSKRKNQLVSDIERTSTSKFGVLVREKSDTDSKIVLGKMHPSNLGDGMIDWFPIAVRDLIWIPLGLSAGLQFLILGVFGGFVMGGSQALARSLFAYIIPNKKSGEFFGFFGFVYKTSSFIGPFIYALTVSLSDTRVGIFSILIFVAIGTVILGKVDVAAGRLFAERENS